MVVMGSLDDDKNNKGETMYKTKAVQFFGRSVPIILQNDNGPCPLLAICNVLLLRNNLKLGSEITEVTLSDLLSFILDLLLDCNANRENRDEDYMCNQRQNISDAIITLQSLATGLNVNVRFRDIHDFEFTGECAVFEVLNIGLVHGWLCDPQDKVTSKVIGDNSYNTLVEKLVALQTDKAEVIDLAAAITDTLGVPSPSSEILMKTISCEEPQLLTCIDSKQQLRAAGEASALLRALKVSQDEFLWQRSHVSAQDSEYENVKGRLFTMNIDDANVASLDSDPIGKDGKEATHSSPLHASLQHNDSWESFVKVRVDSEQFNHGQEAVTLGSGEVDQQIHGSNYMLIREEMDALSKCPDIHTHNKETMDSGHLNDRQTSCQQQLSIFDDDGFRVCPAKEEEEFLEIQTPVFPKSCQVTAAEVRDALKDQNVLIDQDWPVDETRPLNSSDFGVEADASTHLKICEPLYEGEAEAEAGTVDLESRELTYEEEAVLGECTGRREPLEDSAVSEPSTSRMENGSLGIAVSEGKVIEHFLKSNANQLTYYGLFCLQECLKEQELCVFFRNNHFSTMFKYKGDLYLLVTDQGYLSQQNVVWEKLNEVHGDSLFFTGDFTPYCEAEIGIEWDEQKAIAATADYLSSHQSSVMGAQEPDFHDSDLQLAMSLQHQEFEQEPQAQMTSLTSPHPGFQNAEQAARTDGSGLVVEPKKNKYSAKPEAKTKCAIM